MALFHVVEFLEEAKEGLKGPVAVIPDRWLVELNDSTGRKLCNWPPKSVKADASFIIKAKTPDSSWPLHLIRLHKSLNNYQKASQICERLKDMSEVETDDTNTPTTSKRTRITPIRFRDAELTDSEGENGCKESPRHDHSAKQQCPPPLPCSLTNTPTAPKRLTPVRFRDAHLTDSEEENGAKESPRHDHSAMQQCPQPLPYCMPPVVRPRVSETRTFQQISSISPLPTRFQRPLSASTGTHNSLEGTLKQALQHIISLLEELKTEMKDIKNMFAQSQPQEKENTCRELPEGIHLPLKSSEDVESLELDLQTDPGKRAHLECYLRMRGGSNLKQVVRGILSQLFTNELARSYNVHGKKGKKGLKNHPFLLQTVQDAARKTFPAATDVEVQALIAKWLTGARDRDNGRRERAPEHRQLKALLNNSGEGNALGGM